MHALHVSHLACAQIAVRASAFNGVNRIKELANKKSESSAGRNEHRLGNI